MSKRDNPWKNAKHFIFFGFHILVLKGSKPVERRFYTELYRDGVYLASMGSSMPIHWLAALETYLKRGRLLDD